MCSCRPVPGPRGPSASATCLHRRPWRHRLPPPVRSGSPRPRIRDRNCIWSGCTAPLRTTGNRPSRRTGTVRRNPFAWAAPRPRRNNRRIPSAGSPLRCRRPRAPTGPDRPPRAARGPLRPGSWRNNSRRPYGRSRSSNRYRAPSRHPLRRHWPHSYPHRTIPPLCGMRLPARPSPSAGRRPRASFQGPPGPARRRSQEHGLRKDASR